MIQTSLQTITWGDPQHHRFSEIFASASANGFASVEIGFRRLSQVTVSEINALLHQHHLMINASHIGGNLGDLGQAEDERADFESALQHLVQLNVPYLLYSGLHEQQDNKLDAAIEQLNEFADRCDNNGIKLLFHNHDWEFHNNQRIWSRLCESRSQSLGFALDLGWACKAGQDVGKLLGQISGDVRILHFKDFLSTEAGQNTSHLGQGIIDFAPAWEWLSKNKDKDLWITAEQDNADDAAIACEVNGRYLNRQLTEIVGL